jgi:6-phosphogluconolactonase
MRSLTFGPAEVHIYADAGEVAHQAARHFATLADQFVRETGRFTVVLSGGSTPKAMFAVLAAEPFASSLPWSHIYFFWGDERCVPPDHADSNYRMAHATLLAKVPVPPANIFRIPAEDPDHERAATNYSATIAQFFQTSATAHSNTASQPQFDLFFLGMGADGHTASLLPGTAALQISNRIAVANYIAKLDAWRITLIATVINQARHVAFLVTGADKAAPLREVLSGAYQPAIYPSQLIKPVGGRIVWMVDEAAARELTS